MLSSTIRSVFHLKRVHQVLPDPRLSEKARQCLQQLQWPTTAAAVGWASGSSRATAAGSASSSIAPATVLQALECLTYFELSETAVAEKTLLVATEVAERMAPAQLAAVVSAFLRLFPSTASPPAAGPRGSRQRFHTRPAAPRSPPTYQANREACEKMILSLVLTPLMSMLKTSRDGSLLYNRRGSSGASSPSYAQEVPKGENLALLAEAMQQLPGISVSAWEGLARYTTSMLATLSADQMLRLLDVFTSHVIARFGPSAPISDFVAESHSFLSSQPPSYFSMEQRRRAHDVLMAAGLGSSSSTKPEGNSAAAAIAAPQTAREEVEGSEAEATQPSTADLLLGLQQMSAVSLLEWATQQQERQLTAERGGEDIGGAARDRSRMSTASIGSPMTRAASAEQFLAAVKRLAELTTIALPPFPAATAAQGAQKATKKAKSTEEALGGTVSSPPPQVVLEAKEAPVFILILRHFTSLAALPALSGPAACAALAVILDSVADSMVPSSQTTKYNNGLLFIARGIVTAVPDVKAQPCYFLSRVVHYFTHNSELRLAQRAPQQLELYMTALLALKAHGGYAVLRQHLSAVAAVAAAAPLITRRDRILFVSRAASLYAGATTEERSRLQTDVSKVLQAMVVTLTSQNQTWCHGMLPFESAALLRGMRRLHIRDTAVLSGIARFMWEEVHAFEPGVMVNHLYDLSQLGASGELELYTSITNHLLGLHVRRSSSSPSLPGRSFAQRNGATQRLTTKDLCLLLYTFTFVLRGLVRVVQMVLSRLKVSAASADVHDTSLVLYSIVKLRVQQHADVTRPLCAAAASLVAKGAATPAHIASVWGSLRVLDFLPEALWEATLNTLLHVTGPKGRDASSASLLRLSSWKPSELRSVIAALVLLASATGDCSVLRLKDTTIPLLFREVCVRDTTEKDGQQLYLTVVGLHRLLQHHLIPPLTTEEYVTLASHCEALRTPLSSGGVGLSDSVEAAVEVLLGLNALRQSVSAVMWAKNCEAAPSLKAWVTTADDELAPLPPKLLAFVSESWGQVRSTNTKLRDAVLQSGVLSNAAVRLRRGDSSPNSSLKALPAVVSSLYTAPPVGAAAAPSALPSSQLQQEGTKRHAPPPITDGELESLDTAAQLMSFSPSPIPLEAPTATTTTTTTTTTAAPATARSPTKRKKSTTRKKKS